MKHIQHVINALPLVADALGRKCGVKVLIGGEKAYTDGKNIHLPTMPLDADDTILKLARGYIDHESAHLRLTDFDALHAEKLSDAEKYVWNIIEDYRVEKQLADLYPGCGDNFKWLIRHLFLGKSGMETGEEIENASLIFSWLLLSLRAFAVPELVHEKNRLGKMIDRNYPGLLTNLEPLVASIPSICTSTRKAIEVARKIVRFLEKYSSSNENDNILPDNGNEGGHRMNREADAVPPENHQSKTHWRKGISEDKSCQPVQNEATNNHKEKSDTLSTSLAGIEDEAVSNSPLKQLHEILADPSPLEKLDIGKMAGQMLDSVNADNIESGLSVATPKLFNGSRLSLSEISDIRRDTIALRTRLSALVQSKISVRNSIGRNGRICHHRIARLAVCDDRIFVKRGSRGGINTAVHILLDVSGSMGNGNKITLACHACFAVAEALQKIQGVGLAITAFPNGPNGLDASRRGQWRTVGQVLGYRQKMHDRFHIYPNGDTPMAEALWWVLQQMSFLPEKRKILLLLTDGEPDNLSTAKNAIDSHIGAGHEIYGIGICTEAIRKLVRDENCRSIYNLKALASAMFELLRTTLLKPERSNQC